MRTVAGCADCFRICGKVWSIVFDKPGRKFQLLLDRIGPTWLVAAELMRLAVWIFTVAFAAVSSGQETEPQEPLYRAWIEAGAAFPQTTELHSFLGDSKLKFNPGFRVGLGSGYDFTPYFALDWEIGVIGNAVSDLGAFLTQVPLLI